MTKNIPGCHNWATGLALLVSDGWETAHEQTSPRPNTNKKNSPAQTKGPPVSLQHGPFQFSALNPNPLACKAPFCSHEFSTRSLPSAAAGRLLCRQK